MTTIIPAVLPESLEDLAAHAARVRGLAQRVQIDIANGTYAPTTTWPYAGGEGFTKIVSQDDGLPLWEDIEYEVDMLIKDPEIAIDDWIMTGIVGAVVHIETTDRHLDLLEKAASTGIELGWGIKPSTPTMRLFDLIDSYGAPAFVQVMGNDDIGRHGVELDHAAIDKVREIRARYPELPIAIDIGVNEDTAPELIAAGATKLVSGSAIFGSGDPAAAIEALAAAGY